MIFCLPDISFICRGLISVGAFQLTHGCRAFRMESDKMDVTKRFFGLTLEIIYLLTGEDFVVVRESGELISRRVNRGKTFGSKPRHEFKPDEKILKLTSKMIYLLTGEVQRFVEHAEGRNDITENSPPGSSRDKCDHRSSPERCRRHLYSRGSMEEDHAIQQDDNVISIKVEDEEDPYTRGDDQCKDEDFPLEISTDESSNENTPERCPRPLYSPDNSPHNTPHSDQAETANSMKVVIVPHAEDGDDEMKKIRMEISSDYEGIDELSPSESLDSHHSRNSPDWTSNQSVSLEGKLYVCHECGKCIVYDGNLQKTEAGMSMPLCCDCDKASPLKPFRCAKCGKSFSSKMMYMAHQSVHNGGQSFPCSECGMTFSNKSILETHQSIHTGDRPFSCLECGKCFAMKANLVKHLKVHKGEKPFSCLQCSKSFSMKSNLVKHQRVHTGEKPFVCTHCGKSFGMKSNLVKHQRIHTGEKPFKCLECGKCFASRSNLTTHEKIHTGEKPFACSYCNKGFITSSDLSRHQKIHTGDRPFVCSDCGKSFISKSILTSHQKSHTEDTSPVASQPIPEHSDSC